MQLEIRPHWSEDEPGREHITAFEIIAVDHIVTVDVMAVKSTEKEAVEYRDRLIRAHRGWNEP